VRVFCGRTHTQSHARGCARRCRDCWRTCMFGDTRHHGITN
jgi:hypothetical protein